MRAQVLGIIPARMASTRFPGKPLAPLAGKPMIQWVWERARKAKTLASVIIATDDALILHAARAFGAKAEMTRPTHPSGTDRAAEVAARHRCSLVVNIQGDEPLIDPRMIDQAVRSLAENRRFGMATLCREIHDPSDVTAPQVVKVVRRKDDEALYFSRHPIPFARDATDGAPRRFKHIGLYVYRTSVLRDIVRMPVSPLEKSEKLEQLRALENGVRILCQETRFDSAGVDTPEDLARVEALLGCATGRTSPKTGSARR
ncbi:MAG: 3-deoxy-manno-octulosonate cytidylyltransferase [Verrucomicrobiae bacterium]|nr:3-deoxy-manno-octulosonate cytidylyltransferase [Verrucomicrobiae bacterium]